MLLNIQEPQANATSIAKPWRLAVGIDLGTTNTLVTVWKNGTATILSDDNNKTLIPSVVHYHADGHINVGETALAKLTEEPKNTIISVKRFMGRALADIEAIETYPYTFINESDEAGATFSLQTAQGNKSPVQVSADILCAVVSRVKKHFPESFTELNEQEPLPAVITVPAYFDDAQRQATKLAAELANIRVLRLLSEPTAAAVAYGIDNNHDHNAKASSLTPSRDGIFVIYDLGGGTFDLSVLQLERGLFQVLATHGNTALGGDDFDRALYLHVLKAVNISKTPNHQNMRRLQGLVKQARETLTTKTQVTLDLAFLDVNNSGQSIILTRDELVLLTKPLVDKTLVSLKRALKDAKLKPQDIEGIVMVGGATRMPHVVEALTQYFGRKPFTSIDPDTVVAEGAARQSSLLIGNRDDNEGDSHLLLDILPLSLGIETIGGLVERIIPRNTVIPVSRSQNFTTGHDGQSNIAIQVLQGEREMVRDCRSLAKFELRDIPPMAAGLARIKVTFQVDADGLLTVSACEESSGKTTHVEVKPAFGLTPAAIATMLRESMQKAKEDINSRQLAERKTAAQLMLQDLHKTILEDGNLLTDNEHSSINIAINTLTSSCKKDNANNIKNNMETLNGLIAPFAQARMDKYVKKHLKGKKI